MADADLRFYFDPICPFAWITSKWVRQVRAQRNYTVDWRFISLRMVNSHRDYETDFAPGYVASHTAGLRLLRVAARTRAEHGGDAVGAFYEAIGTKTFERLPMPTEANGRAVWATAEFVEPVLAEIGLPTGLSAAMDEESWDAGIQAETDEALALTGKDVGTPILHFEPPTGVAFFGPVISRLPSDEQALELWDHIVGLTRFPAFAELKRSLREPPQLGSLIEKDEAVA